MSTHDTSPLFEIEALHVHFPIRRFPFAPPRMVRAVDGVSLRLQAGRTLGLVGESGCGKTTLLRAAMGLQTPTSGEVRLQGRPLSRLSRRARRPLQPHLQMVFQDPASALNPRMSVHDIVAEPLRLHGRYTAARVDALLGEVGLPPSAGARLAAAFSGGQRQRIGIARALALDPAVLVLDEPVSALDISVQAQVINLLDDLQQRLGLAYLFVAHDLSVVRHVSDDVAVMYCGRIVESGPRDAVFSSPAHPYTMMLMAAVPEPDPRARIAQAAANPVELPDPSRLGPGCAFRQRCPRAEARCGVEAPPLAAVATQTGDAPHLAACWFPGS